MTEVRHRRANAVNPGKHGALDWRVGVGGYTPEHSEIVFVLGMLLVAEDRYDKPGQLGRYLLWYYVDRLQAAKTPEEVLAVAEDCQEAIDGQAPRPKKLSVA